MYERRKAVPQIWLWITAHQYCHSWIAVTGHHKKRSSSLTSIPLSTHFTLFILSSSLIHVSAMRGTMDPTAPTLLVQEHSATTTPPPCYRCLLLDRAGYMWYNMKWCDMSVYRICLLCPQSSSLEMSSLCHNRHRYHCIVTFATSLEVRSRTALTSVKAKHWNTASYRLVLASIWRSDI